MQIWATEETRIYRLNRRLIDIVSAKPTVSVPQALQRRSTVSGTITPETILDGYIRSTIERVLNVCC